VAAHTETEILIVDEVMAVGDTQFQKKCLGKMGDVAKEGRTVLFVSHNLAAIHALCSRAILLEQGRDVYDGNPMDATRRYLGYGRKAMNDGRVDLRSPTIVRAGRSVIFSALQMRNASGEITSTFSPGDDLVIEFELDPPYAVSDPALSIGFDDAVGRRIFSVSTMYSDFRLPFLNEPATLVCTLPGLRLTPGEYSVSICFGTQYEIFLDAIYDAAMFQVRARDHFGIGQMPASDMGLVLVKSNWRMAAKPCI
jgi:lipopolysaccharide transport system ATP-binding protein